MAVEWAVGLGIAVTRLLLRVNDPVSEAADVAGDVDDLWSKLRGLRRHRDPVTKAVIDTLNRQLTADLSVEDDQEIRAAGIQVAALLNELAEDREAVAEAAAFPDRFLSYARRNGGNVRRRQLGQRGEAAFDRILHVACDQFAQLVPSSPTFLPAVFYELRRRVDDLHQETRRVGDVAQDAADYSHQAAAHSRRAVALLEGADRDVVEASLVATRQGVVLGGPVGRWAAADLHVHDTISVGDATGLTPYIPRQHDAVLRQALTGLSGPKMVIVVGTSCTGKTRTCVEAVWATLPQWMLVNPLDVDELTRLLRAGIPGRTVVWLDELQNFLTVAGGLDAARSIRRLLANPRTPPILFLGTIWPDNLTVLEARPTPDQAAVGRSDIHALLTKTKADRVQVPDTFTADEIRAASDDPRVEAAIRHAVEGQVTQVLAGGTELVDRVYGTTPDDAYSSTARAVILAAADLRRVGHPDPLPQWAILGAAPGYLDPAEARWHKSTWAQDALEDLMGEARAQHSGRRDLHHRGVPALRPSLEKEYFELHDYLLQHHLGVRRLQPTTKELWRTLTDSAGSTQLHPEVVPAIARNAELRGLKQTTLELLRKASDAGDLTIAKFRSTKRLAELLVERGDAEALAELRQRADAGPGAARDRWLLLLVGQRDLEALIELWRRAGAGAGDYVARDRRERQLVRRLGGDHQALAELRQRADAGDVAAQDRWLRLLVGQRDLEALIELRQRADAGDVAAQSRWLHLLPGRGTPEGLAELRQLATAGDRSAEDRLLEYLGERVEVVTGLRLRAHPNDVYDRDRLIEGLRRAADAGDKLAESGLARLLVDQGDEVAVAELRQRVHAADSSAAEALLEYHRSRAHGAGALQLNVNADPEPWGPAVLPHVN